MKHKKLILCTVLLLGLGLTGIQAQTMFVKVQSGKHNLYKLNSLQKMTFSSGNVIVLKIDSSIGVYTLNALRYLNFTDISTNVAPQLMPLSNRSIIAYPNPVKDFLKIDLTEQSFEGSISILTLEGKLIQEQKIIDTNTISLNLSHLPLGIYLCRLTNTTVFKTIKIIKQ